MVDCQVKKTWEASYRQGNGLCEDFVVKQSKIDWRNGMNYKLVEPKCKGGSSQR